ncbi:Crp/Fnr family transcriptional regulator [Actinomycetospora straminea]|uniref:CRP-like cAMP-binding protein n=1 Tax=Actinomycetospora straminea TaxID=663607 RepID=A0ABP9EGL3_9PSEU|nr:Crp/Fnr family transcriptional regulator [Actinomycetospora straminea]MDD7931882.1 Crp/Fnr family transcriptional regulator [Actinomycetospora straminea]
MTVTVSAPDARAERVLRACPQLRGLDDATVRALGAASVVRHYAAGEPVFLEGAPGDAMFVLRQGAVVARLSSVAGDVIDLGVAAEGHAFGYFEVLRPGPRTEDAVAVRDSTVVVVPAAAALRAFRSSPDTLLALARDLVRIVSLQNRARSELRRPVDRRLAALLLELAAGRDVVDFGGPQTLLAQRLGIARQTLNTALRALADRGLVTVHPGGRGVTLDRAALGAYAGDA